MTRKITCDESHVYRVDGQIKPGVTTVLQAAGLIDTTWFSDDAALRGTYVHRAVELYHTAGLDMDSLDSIIRPYFEAYLDFLTKSCFRVALVERPLWCQTYDYCGRPDLVGWLNDTLVLLDIKTGAPQKWAGPQTAGYCQLVGSMVDGYQITQRVALQLSSNGKWKLVPFNSRNDLPVFLAALTVWNFKNGRL